MYALVHGFDDAYMVREMLEKSLSCEISFEAFVDSRTLFNIIAKDGGAVERRLPIDVFVLKKRYMRADTKQIGWIHGNENAANVLKNEIIARSSVMWS